HYDDNILRIEKFVPDKVWTLVLFDAGQGFPYLKRFTFEPSSRPQRFVGNEPASRIIILTDVAFPRFEVRFGGNDAVRPALEIDADEFIGVKSFKAKGKRISNFNIDSITELEPLRFPESAETVSEEGQKPETNSVRPTTILDDLFKIDDL
ncbi:MAG: DNA gyrase/topoisomerase IV subunit A, partial [Muribaculaceae bacterium]|nr:DNA gyrase/topoisomerase IV subunit A [Muribaculaceae bacterium]